jgi:tripartite-type tricarboxylate transporter receptor subunit TctC
MKRPRALQLNGMKGLTVLWILAVAVGFGTSLSAQEPFYKDKTVRIIVGFSPGGGFDTYARTIGRHISKHLSGSPTVVVENMTGAGSLVAANHVYKIAKPDGLTMGHFIGGFFLGQVLGQAGVEFDARRFEFVGAAVTEDVVCALTKASGITNMEKWIASKTPVKLGGTAPGAYAPDNLIRILRTALGLPVQVVTGYKGTADIRLAAESGELAGSCWSWDSIKATWRKALDAGNVVPVLKAVSKEFPDLPGIPTALSLAKTEEGRQLIEVGIDDGSKYARPFVLPPGTPKERVGVLRKAFQETLKDPAFIAEAEKSRLGLDPVSGEELEEMVSRLFKLSPGLVAKLKDILYK